MVNPAATGNRPPMGTAAVTDTMADSLPIDFKGAAGASDIVVKTAMASTGVGQSLDVSA